MKTLILFFVLFCFYQNVSAQTDSLVAQTPDSTLKVFKNKGQDKFVFALKTGSNNAWETVAETPVLGGETIDMLLYQSDFSTISFGRHRLQGNVLERWFLEVYQISTGQWMYYVR